MSSGTSRAPVPARISEERLLEIRREAERSAEQPSSVVAQERSSLPHASAETGYYGLPAVKAPQWTWEVPAYFFVGGASGAAAVIAFAANLTHADRRLVRDARWLAAIGGALSPALLVADLGVPSRFLNMLRVFKIQSPMSVGSWTLVAFSSSSAFAAFNQELRRRRGGRGAKFVSSTAELFSALCGLVLASYTGVLIGATAVPVWSESVSLLPIQFTGGGFSTAASLLELRGHSDSRALNIIGITSAAIETWVGAKIEVSRKPALRPIKRGKLGWFRRFAGLLCGPVPFVLRLISTITEDAERSRKLRRAAAVSSVAGSIMMRATWIAAGKASARDPKYALSQTPQRDLMSPQG